MSVIAVDITAELGRHEAAEACNVSLAIIKRRLKSGEVTPAAVSRNDAIRTLRRHLVVAQ